MFCFQNAYVSRITKIQVENNETRSFRQMKCYIKCVICEMEIVLSWLDVIIGTRN